MGAVERVPEGLRVNVVAHRDLARVGADELLDLAPVRFRSAYFSSATIVFLVSSIVVDVYDCLQMFCSISKFWDDIVAEINNDKKQPKTNSSFFPVASCKKISTILFKNQNVIVCRTSEISTRVIPRVPRFRI